MHILPARSAVAESRDAGAEVSTHTHTHTLAHN